MKQDNFIADNFEADHLNYKSIFKGNKQFVQESLAHDPQYFVKLSSGQQPKYLIIGCSDSRVPPNDLTKLKPGDLFIHRNIANQVIPADMNVNSVIQYAVLHLKVKHVIVMGHSKCGGVQAAIDGNAMGGMLDLWLSNLKDVYEKYQDEIDEIEELEKKVERLSELNIMEQVVNVWKNPYIQKSWKKGHPVWVHGWIFRVQTGRLEELVANELMPQNMKAHQFKFDEEQTQVNQNNNSKDDLDVEQFVMKAPRKSAYMKRSSSIWVFDDFKGIQSQMMNAVDNSNLVKVNLIKGSDEISQRQSVAMSEVSDTQTDEVKG